MMSVSNGHPMKDPPAATVCSSYIWGGLFMLGILPWSALAIEGWFTKAHFVTGACTQWTLENHGRFITVEPWLWWLMLWTERALFVGVIVVFCSLGISPWVPKRQVNRRWRTLFTVLAWIALSPFALIVLRSLGGVVLRSVGFAVQ